MCFCGSSSAFHPLAPHESDFLHWTALVLCPSVSCVSVCVSLSRLSSDVLKGLMSGAQAALPPHLQLAFSGKRWPMPPAGCMRLLFVAFFIIFCQDALHLTTNRSLCLCRCQSNAGRRLAEEVLMTSHNSRLLADPVLTDSAHFYAWSAGCPMTGTVFIRIWIAMLRISWIMY